MKPSRLWLLAIYGSLLIPYVGPAVLIVVSSVLYYRWRSTMPERASWLNFHAWIAIALNVMTNVVFILALR